MKKLNNLISYSEFSNQQKMDLNEGLWDLAKKLFGKARDAINKTKGGQDVEKIYKKYLDIINSEFKKQADIELNMGAEALLNATAPKKESVLIKEAETAAAGDAPAGTAPAPDPAKPGEAQPAKFSSENLKKKMQLLTKILDTYKAKALKEMDQVLVKYGGAEKNPSLATIITNKKDQFQLDFLNAQMAALTTAGDTTAVNKIATERDKLAKELETKWNNIQNVTKFTIEVGDKKFSVGTPYRYKTQDGIKTIKVTKKSEAPNKIMAAYVSDKFGKIDEQEFDVANIELEFKPETDKEYNYFSKSNNDIIKIKVVGDEKNDLVEVQTTTEGTPEEKQSKFKVNVGSLIDIK
jgi:hypothetical protein